MLTPDDLRGIAEELRALAGDLRDGHTLRGEWHDDDARREHDRLLAWADALASTEPRADAGLQCLADIRAAVGDSGQMTQRELVECIAGLARDAARYRWAIANEDNAYHFAGLVAVYGPSRDDIDGSIDAAMMKEASK